MSRSSFPSLPSALELEISFIHVRTLACSACNCLAPSPSPRPRSDVMVSAVKASLSIPGPPFFLLSIPYTPERKDRKDRLHPSPSPSPRTLSNSSSSLYSVYRRRRRHRRLRAPAALLLSLIDHLADARSRSEPAVDVVFEISTHVNVAATAVLRVFFCRY
jgi:hypothetical protein